jgi:hypothetical protein
LELERELCVNVLCAGATPAEGIPGEICPPPSALKGEDSHGNPEDGQEESHSESFGVQGPGKGSTSTNHGFCTLS